MKAAYFKELHIASLASGESWHELKVNTLLQNPNAKQPSINAFLGARYSRSADPVVDIAKEVYLGGKDAAKRLESIFFNYGHKSVGDMADIFLCLENIPIFLAQRFFYLNPVHAGQERSTRYQDFSEPRFVRFPDELKVSKQIKHEYEQLFKLSLQNYQEMRAVTEIEFRKVYRVDKEPGEVGALKARVFDTIRYFLPIGLQTSIGVVMSARSWAERISYYRASKFRVERELGDLISSLLIGTPELMEMGYLPEADGLVRHTDPDNSRNESCKRILKLLDKQLTSTKVARLKVFKGFDPALQLLENYYLLQSPWQKLSEKGKYKKLMEKMSQVIFKHHDHHHQLGNVAQTGSYLISGTTDYGVLKDLVRHRSFEKFIPLFEENLDLKAELGRDPASLFRICDYLEDVRFKKLNQEYTKRMMEYYKKVLAFIDLASSKLPQDVVAEYGRYVLNHGFNTHYKFYGSFDDLAYTIALRTRNGGHIAYRKLTRDWLDELTKLEPLWIGLNEKLPKALISSREQFVDRS